MGLTKVHNRMVEGAQVSVKDFGVVGDGVVDDTTNFQAALDHASDNGLTAVIPASCNIRLTRNIYIHGTGSLKGANRKTSILTFDADLALADGSSYAFCCGPRSYGDNNGAVGWHGKLSNFKIVATVNAAFSRCIFFFSCMNSELSDCIFDFTAPTDANQGMSVCESGNDAAWNVGELDSNARYGMVIRNNWAEANQYDQVGDNGGESYGMALCDNVIIDGNYARGFGDDQGALHKCNHATVSNNTFYSPGGRMLATDSIDVTYENNYCEREPLADGTWRASWFASAGLETTTGPAATNIRYINNVFKAPAGSSISYWIRIRGAQDSVISGNTFICDTVNAGTLISIEKHTLSGWGAGSLVVEDTDGTARPRNITVINNKVTGLLPDGWISELGTELRGPFFYDNNLAGGYSAWTGNHKSTFTATNKTVTGDAAGMQAVRPWSLIGEPDAKNLIIPTVVASTTYTAKLGGVLDSWVHGKPFYMCGVLVLSENVSAGATASVTIKVYKNGVEVSSQAVILATERTHMAYFYNIADMVFGANDLVKVTATTNAAVDATSLTLRPMMVADGYYDDA